MTPWSAARQVLDRYHWDGSMEVVIERDRADGEAYLALYGDDWPGAWKIPDGVQPEEFEPDCNVDSYAGFEQFLRAIQAARVGYFPVRILNCLGLRAEESPARAKKQPFDRDLRSSNGKRTVDVWLPIHGWSTEQVWQRIRASGVPHHPAYDLGMPRLSCCFCIFSPRSALLLAGKHNPELLAEYVAVERRIGHTFRQELPLASIQEALASGEQPGPVQNWTM